MQKAVMVAPGKKHQPMQARMQAGTGGERRAKPGADHRAAEIGPEIRQAMIAEAAYFRAQSRGFNGGDTVEDWLQAEAEVDDRLRDNRGR